MRLFICHHRGDVTKIQRCAQTFWLGACYRILRDCIAQVDQFLECEAHPQNFVTTGGVLLISSTLHVFSLRWGQLYETQREATEFT